MKRNNPKVNEKQEFRFYKSNLPKVVWNPNADKSMADFEGGTFTTSDKSVALILLEKGYPQIPIDATEPPEILVRIPGQSLQTNESLGHPDNIKIGLGGTNKDSGVLKPVVQEGI